MQRVQPHVLVRRAFLQQLGAHLAVGDRQLGGGEGLLHEGVRVVRSAPVGLVVQSGGLLGGDHLLLHAGGKAFERARSRRLHRVLVAVRVYFAGGSPVAGLDLCFEGLLVEVYRGVRGDVGPDRVAGDLARARGLVLRFGFALVPGRLVRVSGVLAEAACGACFGRGPTRG